MLENEVILLAFSDRLRSLRIDSGKQQQEVANDLKLLKQTLNKYEKGNREPDFEVVKRLADYYNVTLDYLLGKTDIKSSLDKEIEFLKKWLAANADGIKLIDKINNNNISLEVINAYVDGLISNNKKTPN